MYDSHFQYTAHYNERCSPAPFPFIRLWGQPLLAAAGLRAGSGSDQPASPPPTIDTTSPAMPSLPLIASQPRKNMIAKVLAVVAFAGPLLAGPPPQTIYGAAYIGPGPARLYSISPP